MLKPPKTSFMNLQSLQLTTSDYQEQSQVGLLEQLRENIQKLKESNIFSSDACVIKFEDYLESKCRKINPEMVYSMSCRKSLAKEKQERQLKVRKYLEKRRGRNIRVESQPLYQKKRVAANKRLRIQGQFLSKDETMMMKNAYGNHVFDKKQNFNLEVLKQLQFVIQEGRIEGMQLIWLPIRKQKTGHEGSHQIPKGNLNSTYQITDEKTNLQNQLDYILRKCFQEKLMTQFKVHSPRFSHKSQSKTDKHQNIRNTIQDNSSNIQQTVKYYSEEELYNPSLEYTPPNPFHRTRLHTPNLIPLPLIPIIENRRKENVLSTFESEPMTRKNKQTERTRTFSMKVKNIKAGVLQLDPENPQILALFRKYSTNQASKMDIFLELTKQQLAQYLAPNMGSIPQITRLLTYLNYPQSMTYFSFKQFLLQLNELQHNDILYAVFHAFDSSQKGYLLVNDVFEMFKSEGAAAIDANLIFKAFPELPSVEHTVHIPKIKVQQGKKKQLITMIQDSPRRNSQAKKQKQQSQMMTFQNFQQIYKDKLPEFFKQFVKAFFCDYTQ